MRTVRTSPRLFLAATTAGLTLAVVPPHSNAAAETGMQDVATSAGVAIAPTMTYGGLVFDYDGDRRPDLLVGRHGTNTGLLHHNDGGRFSVAVGLPRADRHACASADVNADGLRDFYCSVGADGGTSTTKSNELWLQQRGGGFTNAAAVWGVSDNYGRGRQVVFFDANGDRRPDLFVTNDYPRSDGVPTPNRLFLNAGTRFVESRSPVLTRELGGREVAIGDVDRDGRTDIVLAGNRHLFVFRNTASGWVDSTEAMGLRAQYASDVALRDVNADGRLDLLQVKTGRFELRLQHADGTYPRTPSFVHLLTSGWRIAAGDVQGDGYTDIYIVQGGTPQVVKEQLAGTTSGRFNSTVTTNPPDVLLMGTDRTGVRYTGARIPQADAGLGDDVLAVDRSGTGRTGLVVLNGFAENRGPVQYLEYAPVR